MSYTLSCVNYSCTKCFKNCKNISTYGEVIVKIKVACFFLGHGVYKCSGLCLIGLILCVTTD